MTRENRAGSDGHGLPAPYRGFESLPTLVARHTGGHERRRPETTTLDAVVRDHVETLYAAVAAGFGGAALPPFVRRELEGYLDCGLICRGFVRLKGESCSEQHLMAFACEGRGICPKCPD